MRRFSERSYSNLIGVRPQLVHWVSAFLQVSPFDFIVIEGLRDPARQQALFDQGKSRTLNSRHLTGHAVDLLPIGPDGPKFDRALYEQMAPAALDLSRRLGVPVVWGGHFRSFYDGPHFELERSRFP